MNDSLHQQAETSLSPQENNRFLWWRPLLQRLRRILPFGIGILAAFAALFLYNYFLPPLEPLTERTVDDRISEALAEITPAPAFSTTVYEFILPSIVFIKTSSSGPVEGNLVRSDSNTPLSQSESLQSQPIAYPQQEGDSQENESQDDNPIPDEEPEEAPDAPEEEPEPFGIGSGVVISADGMILTALHIVDRAEAIQVTFADGTQANAVLAAAEPDNDIAVLQVDRLPEIFAAATLGNPNSLRVGDEAYVVGNPLGLAGSMSAGVISGLNRTATPDNIGVELERLIQFDAAVNPGNSGGPLLNRNGEVVGIVVGLINPMDGADFSGIGLAVRIDVAGGAAGAPPQ